MTTGLTEQQLAAVNAPANQHVVLEATAGSGKTHTLGYRIIKLVEEYGVSPDHIILATFSASQAEDMALRIFSKHPQLKGTALEHGFAPGTGQILTLHALAYRMLRFYDDQYKNLKIEDWRPRSIIEKKVEDMKWYQPGKDGELVGYKSILYWIDKVKANVDGSGEPIKLNRPDLIKFYGEHMTETQAQRLAEVTVHVQQELQRAGCWTFADMLRECELKMRNDQAFREHWSQRFTHLLIDECQDTNAQTMRIVSYFENATLFIVGDADQTLYRFNGAAPEINLRQGFDERYGDNSQRLVMTRCFRCQPTVLLRADNLIQKNYGTHNAVFYKKIEPREDVQPGPDLTYDWYSDPESEASAVVSEVAERIQTGDMVPGDVMIMSRINAQMAPVEIALLQHGIPFVNLGMSSFFGRQVPKIVIGYMRLCMQPDHWESFEAVYNIPSKWFESRGKYSPTRYLGREFLEKLDRKAPSLLVEASRNKHAKNRKGWAQWTNGVLDIEDTFMRLQDFKAEDNAAVFISELRGLVLDRWMEEEFGLETDASESVRDDLEMLNRIASIFNIQQFLAYVTQLQTVKKVKAEDLVDYVLIGTVYRFKGLERRAVWGIGWSDRLFPHRFSLGEPCPTDGLPVPQVATIWDERNLAYVAVTRAKEECHLSGTASWVTIKEPLEPSRFIKEMGLPLPSEKEKTEKHLERDMEDQVCGICDECGDWVHPDELEWIHGRWICPVHPDYVYPVGREDNLIAKEAENHGTTNTEHQIEDIVAGSRLGGEHTGVRGLASDTDPQAAQ